MERGKIAGVEALWATNEKNENKTVLEGRGGAIGWAEFHDEKPRDKKGKIKKSGAGFYKRVKGKS